MEDEDHRSSIFDKKSTRKKKSKKPEKTPKKHTLPGRWVGHWNMPNRYSMGNVSENSGTPKSSILIGFSIINHPFGGTPIFGTTHMDTLKKNRSWLATRRHLFRPSSAGKWSMHRSDGAMEMALEDRPWMCHHLPLKKTKEQRDRRHFSLQSLIKLDYIFMSGFIV